MPNRSKKRALSGKSEFDAVFSGQRLSTPEVVFFFTRNGLDLGRLGLVIPKKVIAQAVQRNRLRRRLRDLFRHFADRLNGFDVVCLARGGSRLFEYDRLKESFEKLADAAHRSPIPD